MSSTEKTSQLVIERLASLRTLNGFSLRYVAENAGIARSYLGFLEQGKYRPTLDVVIQIAAVFGVRLSQILDEVEELSGEPEAKEMVKKTLKRFTLGEELRRARHSKGKRQDEVATQAQILRSRLSVIERDKVTPSVDELHAICQAIGVRMASVIERAEAGKKD